MSTDQKDVKATKDDSAIKLQAKFKETWSKLSTNDISLFSTNREQFLGKLKEIYSLSKEDAEKKIKALEEHCGCSSSSTTAKVA